MLSRHRILLAGRLLTGALVFASSLFAQSVNWTPSGGTLAKGETVRLDLVFEDCAPKGSINLPAISGLELGSPSTSQRSSFNIVNGSATRSSTVTLTYPAAATGSLGDTISIPALNLETNKGRITVPAANFTVGQATVGNNQTTLAEVASARFLTPPAPVWAGQVFALGYTLEVAKSHFYQLGSHLNWKPAPLLIEDWPQPDMTEIMQNGTRNVRINYRTFALATTPGELSLQPASQLVNLTTGSTSYGFFAQPEVERFTVTSDPAKLTVKPLPSPAPTGFTGIVGDFTLTATAVPLDAKVGEPITWTLKLAGTGNWPSIQALPSREVSKDFRVVQPQAKRTPGQEGSLFDATLSEDVVLIPTRAGTHTLGPVSLTIFDPIKGEYQTLTTKAFTVKITGAAQSKPPVPSVASQGNEPPTTTTPASSDAAPEVAPNAPPAAIPLDPLSLTGKSTAPLPMRSLLWLAAIPFVLPPLLWIVLAIRRARRTDPALARREAHARLRKTLDQLATSPSAETVRAWRDDTAILWQLKAATPTSRDFSDPVWAALWAGSERLLYRSSTPIDADWIKQAREVLATHPVPGFSVWQLFRGRNLFPWVNTLALALALLAIAQPAFAADPSEAYTSGDFKTAEAGWRERIQNSPTDSAAHYNLSLALAQQERWAESAAHAAIAWLQQPASPETRWQLALAATKAPKTTSAVSAFTGNDPKPAHSLARLISPANWQLLLVASGIIGAVSLTLLVLSGYMRISSRYALILLIIALIAAGGSAVALHTYGPLLKPHTALVWQDTTLYSVPTEAADKQQSSTLGAGTLATVGRDFLGWRQITLANGQTGWVRSDALAGLWTNP